MVAGIKEVPFRGISMRPTLRDGDSLIYSENTDSLALGDVLLFRDPVNSEFVAHRLIELDPFTTKGDWSRHSEEVPRDNVFGKVVGVNRNGKTFLLRSDPKANLLVIMLSKSLIEGSWPLRQLSRIALYLIRPTLIKRKSDF